MQCWNWKHGYATTAYCKTLYMKIDLPNLVSLTSCCFLNLISDCWTAESFDKFKHWPFCVWYSGPHQMLYSIGKPITECAVCFFKEILIPKLFVNRSLVCISPIFSYSSSSKQNDLLLQFDTLVESFFWSILVLGTLVILIQYK